MDQSIEMMIMRPFFIITLVGGALLGLILQGSFLSFLLIVIGVEYILAPAAILLLVASATLWWTGRLNPPWLKQACFAWCTVACGLFVLWATGRGVNGYEVNSVHAYVAKTVPLLEQIKKQEGAYPTALPVLQSGSPPILLQTNDAYTSDGKQFRFQYSNPAGFVGEGEQFDSATRQWNYFDPMD